MTQIENLKGVALQMLSDQTKSMAMGVLLRSYATQEELETVYGILVKCEERQSSSGKTLTGTVLDQFTGLVKAIKK